MIPGLSTHVFFDQRLHPGLLDAIAGSGAQTIEVFAARHHFDYTNAQQVRETASWFRSNPIRAVLHQPVYLTDGRTFSGADPGQWSRHISPNLNLISDRKNARIVAMDEVKRAFESAEQIPFAAAVLHLGLRDTTWDEYAVEYSMTAIEHLKAFAGPLAMKILVENLQNEVATPEHLLQILRTGHFDNVGVCLDLGHLHLTAEPPPAKDSGASVPRTEGSAAADLSTPTAALTDAIALLGARIGQLHIHDNHGPFGHVSSPAELHDEHLWPGEGSIEWPVVMAAIEALPAATPAILEPASTRDMPAEEVTRKAVEVFDGFRRHQESAAVSS
jgi:sugar phosphate isomerase/epimerase